MEIRRKLFDSNIHKWSKNDSEFGSKLKGHRNVFVVIEDTNGNIFGGYCSKQIGIRKLHYDSKSFVFSMKRNNVYEMKKYSLKNGCDDFYIDFDSSDVLFAFGGEEKNNTNYFRDVCVVKKNSTNKHYCQQYSYEYNGKVNALRGSKYFEVKRIVVYEM